MYYTYFVASATNILRQKSLVLIFAYAPAGLGHLRVTDALYSGIPADVQSYLMGSHDKKIMFLHRIFSIHPLLRRIFEWLQYNPQQYIFSAIYRWVVRSDSKAMYEQVNTILDQRLETPNTVLIVATHFALAHQVGVIKKRIEDEKKVRVILALQVTDDSPQFMWYVPEADITFVPSEYTKKELEKYGEWIGFPKTNLVVNAYPVSPHLYRKLNPVDYHEKAHQLEPDAKSQIHVTIPISGAAVGLEYATKIIDQLYKTTHRFIFHVVTRTAPYTLPFLNEMIQRPYVKLYVSANDRDVVNAYEHVYGKHTISMEITKPSEQAFKTLLYPQQRGGVILLFSEPVGRQEYDNINFMYRHKLIPDKRQQVQLWKLAKENKKISENLLEQSKNWRGVILPSDSEEAGCFIWWGIQNNLFSKMMQYKLKSDMKAAEAIEVNPFGVADFWEKLSKMVSGKDPLCND